MSPIIDDLQIEAEIPPRPQRPGTSVVVTLRFINVGTQVRRIYLIGSESYRFGQSMFRLHVGAGEPLVQPARRGSYVPTAADVHELAPRTPREFTQTLRLPRSIDPGKHEVEWIYENQLECVPSVPSTPSTPKAVQSLAGIWVGRLVDTFSVQVARGQLGPRE
jgi:hypothetical protein